MYRCDRSGLGFSLAGVTGMPRAQRAKMKMSARMRVRGRRRGPYGTALMVPPRTRRVERFNGRRGARYQVGLKNETADGEVLLPSS
jgi:hypothetical protein